MAAAGGRSLSSRAASPCARGASLASTAAADALLIRRRSERHFCSLMLLASAINATDTLINARGSRASTARARAVAAGCAACVGAYALRARLPAALERRVCWLKACLLLNATTMCLMGTFLMEHVLRFSEEHCPGQSRSQCARSYFRWLHAPLMCMLHFPTQLPARHLFFPELLRNASYVAAALAVASAAGELTGGYAARVVGEAVACTSATPLFIHCVYDPPASVLALLADVDVCPRPLRRCRDASVALSGALRAAALRGRVLLDVRGTIVLSAVFVGCGVAATSHAATMQQTAAVFGSAMALTIGSGVLVTLRPFAEQPLDEAAAAIVRSGQARTLAALRAQLDAGATEGADLAAGCAAALALCPGAAAAAMGTFAEGCATDALAALEVAAAEEGGRAALHAALHARVGAPPAAPGGARGSSVWRVCGGGEGGGSTSRLLDSGACEGGLSACSDWADAARRGLASRRALTLPLAAGPVTVGFLTLHLGVFASDADAHSPPAQEAWRAPLAELCDAVAAAVFVRRALAVGRDTFSAGLLAAGVPSASADAGAPAWRATSPRRAAGSPTDGRVSAGGAGGTPAEQAAALAALDASAAADAATLSSWSLDPWALPDAEVQRLLLAMLHEQGLLRSFSISPLAAAAFIADVAAHYDDGNAFHTFRHAAMVTATAWRFLTGSRLRAARLRDVDVLALLLSAMCHDLEHPGVTNSFQVNTRSALALRYNDASCNENHHCAVAFTLLHAHGLLRGLCAADARAFRKCAVAAILATDMACHKDLLARVTARLAAAAAAAAGEPYGAAAAAPHGAAPGGDEATQLLTVSFALHCADLCCPLLPPPLSRRISQELSREFAAQAALERAAGLPVTVMEAHTEIAKAKMEVRDAIMRACVRAMPLLTHARAADCFFGFRVPPAVCQTGGPGADAGRLPGARGCQPSDVERHHQRCGNGGARRVSVSFSWFTASRTQHVLLAAPSETAHTHTHTTKLRVSRAWMSNDARAL
jgi:hypothetical protein